MPGRRVAPGVTFPQPSSGQLAAGGVGLTIAGMAGGTVLLLASAYPSVGWLLFILSFGGWLGAALLALREGWQRGWFDR